MSVVAAIPNYNMAESLAVLLPQVLKQGYDAVYVLDDASTDNSHEVARRFAPSVRFVKGKSNVGPGANRNRIIGALKQDPIIHFMDADIRLISHDNPGIIRAEFKKHPRAGVIGGLIRLPDGTPWMYNYGPRYSLYSSAGGWAQALANNPNGRPLTKNLVGKVSGWRHRGYPDVSKSPAPKQVFWVGEANFCVHLSVFRKVGGFDPDLRYHETQDLAYKLHKKGYDTWFSPAIAVEHPKIKLRDVSRKTMQGKAGRKIVRKHGLHLK